MAYDLKLAQRVRTAIGSASGLSEKEQFGGIAFLVRGNVACGIIGEDLLVRVGPDMHDVAMKMKGAKPFSLTGRPSKGWVLVGQSGLKGTSAMKKWVEMGMEFARSLPPKHGRSAVRRELPPNNSLERTQPQREFMYDVAVRRRSARSR